MSFFFFLLRPSYWLMNEPFCKEWDKLLNERYKDGITDIDTFSCRIGGILVWTGNHPYNSFTPYMIDGMRPSRKTIYKLHKLLISEKVKHLQ